MTQPTERTAPAPVLVRSQLEEDDLPDLEIDDEVLEPVAPASPSAGRPTYKMAPGSLRRPFGGRMISKDNMDVPAFMRKQMD